MLFIWPVLLSLHLLSPQNPFICPSRVDCQQSPGLNQSTSPTGHRWPYARHTVVAPVGCTPTPMSTPYATRTVAAVVTSSRWRVTSTRTSTTGGSSRIQTGRQELGLLSAVPALSTHSLLTVNLLKTLWNVAFSAKARPVTKPILLTCTSLFPCPHFGTKAVEQFGETMALLQYHLQNNQTHNHPYCLFTTTCHLCRSGNLQNTWIWRNTNCNINAE